MNHLFFYHCCPLTIQLEIMLLLRNFKLLVTHGRNYGSILLIQNLSVIGEKLCLKRLSKSFSGY